MTMNTMTTFISRSDVAASREQLGTPGQEIWRTWFLKPAEGAHTAQAFIVEYAPGRVLRTHFHDEDEFQIVVAGEGMFGRHAVSPYMVHFARAYTPYGPIVAGAGGLSFLTLRARRDSAGPQLLPDKRAALDAIADRRPWQASQRAELASAGDQVAVRPLPGLEDARGLAASAITLPADGRVALPDLVGKGGRYIALLEGSLIADGRSVDAMTIAFDAADADAVELVAGRAGARLLSLTFPPARAFSTLAAASTVTSTGLKAAAGLSA